MSMLSRKMATPLPTPGNSCDKIIRIPAFGKYRDQPLRIIVIGTRALLEDAIEAGVDEIPSAISAL